MERRHHSSYWEGRPGPMMTIASFVAPARTKVARRSGKSAAASVGNPCDVVAAARRDEAAARRQMATRRRRLSGVPQSHRSTFLEVTMRSIVLIARPSLPPSLYRQICGADRIAACGAGFQPNRPTASTCCQARLADRGHCRRRLGFRHDTVRYPRREDGRRDTMEPMGELLHEASLGYSILSVVGDAALSLQRATAQRTHHGPRAATAPRPRKLASASRLKTPAIR
jgi:hypothetical protein